MIKIKVSILFLVVALSSCKKNDDNLIGNGNNDPLPNIENTSGYRMLLIGNSFFRPYAEKLNYLAIDAGLEEHNSTTVFRGGANGQPINFWNDSTTQEHAEIKSTLDMGDIEIFGMTSGHDYENPEDRIEGHRAWIEYALQKNPNTSFFIAIPPIDFPAQWDSLAQANGYNTIEDFYGYFVNSIVHNMMVNQLRDEFPSVNIFTIPTGWATFNLCQMYLDDLLLDEINLFGQKETSIFTDQKGHQGDIVIETGGLVWLNSVYNIDLSSYNYETGFHTDLHEIAIQIMNNHDPEYKK